MPYHVLEINDIAPLDEWRGEWNELLRQTPGATFFHSLDWLEVYWEHYAAEQELRVLLIVQGEMLKGIVPFVIRTERRRIGNVRILTYPLDDWASFYSPIAESPRPVLEAALSHIQQSPGDWDLLSLRWIDGGSVEEQTDTLSSHEAALKWAGFKPYASVRDTTGIVRLTGTWDEYTAGWTSKYRTNLRRSERRFNEQGEVTYERYRPLGAEAGDSDPRFDLFDECQRLASISWQGGSETGTTISHESVQAFFRTLHERAAQVGALDVNLIRLDGRPVAFAYNYHYQGIVFGARCGYDPEFARFGVGTLMFCKAIEDSYARGDLVFDMGPGSIDCKKKLATHFVSSHQLTHYRPFRAKAQLMRLKQIASQWFGEKETAEQS